MAPRQRQLVDEAQLEPGDLDLNGIGIPMGYSFALWITTPKEDAEEETLKDAA